MPPGFWAELPPALAYVGFDFMENPGSDWWVVQCTGWVMIVACYLRWDAYDTSRLWGLSARL